MSTQKIPSVSVIGCGGAGCNTVRKLMKAWAATKAKADLSFTVIDTSKSNFHDLEGATVVSMDELGAGKDRSKCIPIIQHYFDTHPQLSRDATDISIIVSSFSGGSGNVIAALLTQRIMRHTDSKAVIIVGITDTSSERDTINSINSIKTFNKIAKDLNICIPMLMFSNTLRVGDNPKPGRIGVDKSVASRLVQMIQLLTSVDVTELDFNDKLTYLRPQDSGAESGLYTVSISATDLEHTENLAGEMDILVQANNIVHSVLVVNKDGSMPDLMAEVSYVGVDTSNYISIISHGLPPTLTQDLVDSADRYQHSVKMKSTMENDFEKFGNEDKTGLVL